MIMRLRGFLLSLWQLRLLSLSLLLFCVSACRKPYLAQYKPDKGKKVYARHLLYGNKIIFEKQKAYQLLDEEERLGYELASLIQQKPNQKFLFAHPKRWIFARFDTLHYVHQFDSSGQYLETKTERRQRSRVGRWLMRKVAERPAILDTARLNRSTRSMENQLVNNGYYNAKVRSEVKYKKHKAYVSYVVATGKRILIDTVHYHCEDSMLLSLFWGAKRESLLKPKAPLDQNLFLAEKARLVTVARNSGYQQFSANALSFEADTVNARRFEPRPSNFFRPTEPGDQGEPRAVIHINIKAYSDTLKNHPRYRIRHVFIFPDDLQLQPHSRRRIERDTVHITEYRQGKYKRRRAVEDSLLTEQDTAIQKILYIRERERLFKPLFLSRAIMVKQGELYHFDRMRQSLRNLTELDVFRFPRIEYLPSISGQPYELDCHVRVRPAESQVISPDLEFNTDNANLGFALNLNYRNRNIFRSGEAFIVNMEGGLDFNPRGLSDSARQNNDNRGIVQWINLLDINSDVGLSFPRFLGWPQAGLRPYISNPRTRLLLGYRYLQQSTIFRVSSFLGRYGYEWNSRIRHQFVFNPFLLNFTLNPQLDPTFRQRLERSNRALLASLQERFFIPSSDFTYTYSTVDKGGTSTWFAKGYFESAGNFTSLVDLISGQSSLQFVGIDYSQYLKGEFDIRRSRDLNRLNSLVGRIHGGVALPLGATVERGIPFSRRFFLGGPNSMRAWNIRHLGPGRLRPVEGAEFQLGDILLEINLEYRRKLNSWISLGIFADAGNVWLMYPQKTANLNFPRARPEEGVFNLRFYEELALGAGLGLRLDFSFFIFRLDYAAQVINPAGYELLPSGEYRIFNTKPWLANRSNWIIAVGYPF